MEIKITVDESMFKDVLDKELNALTPEEIHEVLVSCIKEYFTQNNYANIEKLITTTNNYGWGGTDKTVSEFTNKLIASCDYSGLQEVVDKAVEDIKDKHEYIMKDLIRDMIVKSLTDSFAFKSSVENSIREYLWRQRS